MNGKPRRKPRPGQAENGISHHAGSFVERLLGGNDHRCRLPSQIERTYGRGDDALAQLGDVDPARGETALALFDSGWRDLNPRPLPPQFSNSTGRHRRKRLVNTANDCLVGRPRGSP